MAKSSIKEKMKEQLRKRMNESNQRSEDGGGRGVLKGDNLTFWNPKAKDDHVIDIIPYVAGKNSPLNEDLEPKNPEGEVAYVLEFWQHKGLGPDDNQKALCLSRNYNKPCPICERRKELINDDADEELIKSLAPSLRCTYNVIVYDSEKEEAKGIQLWSVSHWFSEKVFQKTARKVSRRGKSSGDPFIYYMDIDEGKSISFYQEDKNEMFKLSGVKFEDRDYQLDEKLIEEANCLEDLLKIPTYDELKRLLMGDEDTEDENKKTKRTSTRSVKKEEVKKEPETIDEDDEDEEEEEKEKSKVKRIKREVKKEPETIDEEEEEEEEDDEEKEEKSKVVKKKTKKEKKSSKFNIKQKISNMDKDQLMNFIKEAKDAGYNIKVDGDIDEMDEEDLFYEIDDWIEENVGD